VVLKVRAMMVQTKSKIDAKTHRVDPDFKYELLKTPGGESLKTCYQCGTCTATCPIARITGTFRPNRLIHMVKLGVRDVLKDESLWLCAVCYSCLEKCPQGVEVTEVIRALKNKAVEEGCIPECFLALANCILATGMAFAVPESRLARRGILGLPPLPRTNLDDLKRLAETSGLLRLKGRS
jgi:heterodisulfide reductase subunit C